LICLAQSCAKSLRNGIAADGFELSVVGIFSEKELI
jgi:hypothetical protein